MVKRLTPYQANKIQELVKLALQRILQPESNMSGQILSNVHKSILSGALQVWIMYGQNSNGNKSDKSVMCLTTINEDKILGIRSLHVYGIFGNVFSHSKEEWANGLKQLSDFAYSQDCKNITGIVKTETGMKLIEEIGAHISGGSCSIEI